MSTPELDNTMPGVRSPWTVTGSPDAKAVPALVIAWSERQPERIGQVAFLPDDGSAMLLGRGPAREDDPSPRVTFCEQRPGVLTRREALLGPRISRQQLSLRLDGEAIEVERVGSCPMMVNGAPTDKATLRPGDTLYLKDQLILFCDYRSTRMSVANAVPESMSPAFGGPDGFGIVGESAASWKVRADLAFIGRAKGHALVLGQSGVGKEMAARAIHGLSERADKALVSRSAATIPDSLIDAELFGNVGNYPNPGMRERPGLIGEAHGSTLFLDEIGELPEPLQARLLRVLDSGGEYSRLGESKSRKADARLIAATNRGTDELKSDFGARFTLRLEIPGLNHRRADIPLLIRHLMRRAAKENPDIARRFFPSEAALDESHPRIAPDLVDALLRHTYTLHVRELDKLLWKAILASPEQFVLLTAGVQADLKTDSKPARPTGEVDSASITEALERHQGNVTRAARELGLKNRYVLYRLMKKYGIEGSEG